MRVACTRPRRRDEGTCVEGYTVHEACQLARSSLPAQRVAACRMLAAILCAARPPACAHWPDGGVEPRAIPAPSLHRVSQAAVGACGLPATIIAVPSQCMRSPLMALAVRLCLAQASNGAFVVLDWADVWAHALAADVTVTLRLALDDSAAAVVTAAAQALAELVGAEDMALGPSHADSPELPCVPARCLQRPHPVGAWSAHAVEPPSAADSDAVPPQHPLLEQQEDGGAPRERHVARVDPPCGLLQMQVGRLVPVVGSSAMESNNVQRCCNPA